MVEVATSGIVGIKTNRILTLESKGANGEGSVAFLTRELTRYEQILRFI